MAINVNARSKWSTLAVLASAALSITAAFSLWRWRKKLTILQNRIQELESSFHAAVQNCSAERKGRIRAQQALRRALTDKTSGDIKSTAYPMTPIGGIESCFWTRNGTPRQPLLVPHARACLILHSGGIPQATLEGLVEYSHCWILYVFHKNTDLPRLWEQQGHTNFKAKVRVPRLQGGKMGVLATRSPHRPCPIGLSVAKVEAVHGRMLLLSGVDLVDGTPVLDIKPYLPYCDNVQGAKVPDWIMADGVDDPLAVASVIFSPDFSISLVSCWEAQGKQSLYTSPNEFQILIEQILSRDIRSLSQRLRPHKTTFGYSNMDTYEDNGNWTYISQDNCIDENDYSTAITSVVTNERESLSHCDNDIVEYHIIVEGIDVSYTIDGFANVVIHRAALTNDVRNGSVRECNHTIWSNLVSKLPNHVA